MTLRRRREIGARPLGPRTKAILIATAWLASCDSTDRIRELEDLRRADSARLVEAIRGGSSEQRARAALAMGRIQSTSYVEPLAAAVQDQNKDVRLATLFAIGQLGLAKGAVVPDAAVEACRACLDDPDPEIVAAAVEALGKLATPAMPEAVRPYLDHSVPRVRSAAALALFRCRFVPLWREQAEDPPELPAEALADLIAALRDPDSGVRRSAAYAFSRYGQAEAAAALAELVDDDDEWTRLFTVRAIGRSEDRSVAGVVEQATRDSSARVRTEAVAALATLGESDRLVEELADDPSFHVRSALAGALADGSDARSIETLRSLENDVSPTVRSSAIAALAARLGIVYERSLLLGIGDEDWRMRAASASAARRLGDRALALIERALEDADSRVQTAALGALEELEGGDDLIMQALDSRDLAVRGTAVSLFAARDHARKLEQFTAVYHASAGVDWIEIREAVVDALAGLDGAQALLRRIAENDPTSSVRAKARLALQGKGAPLPDEPDRTAEISPFLHTRFDVDPIVVLDTTKGTIEIRGLSQQAPIHVASFVKLVREGFYDGLIWHRVVSNFVIQGGDPRGDGWGSAGYTLRDEINTERYGRGAVGMPKAGKDTGGCQIFITHVPTPHLDGNYTVFGRVVAGMDVVDRIEVGDRIVTAELKR